MNRATVIGFVANDPETRAAADGRPVTVFPVSLHRRWITSTGEARESTQWLHVVSWGKLAEAARSVVHKNRRIYAEGRLQTRTWKDHTGGQRFVTELVSSKLIPVDHAGALPAPRFDADDDETPLCLNRAVVIGNLGRDPEMRYAPSGEAFASFTVAATRGWMDSHGQMRQATEWFHVVCWGGLAEICSHYLSKGRRVYVEGELRSRIWEGPEGTEQLRMELVASEMILLGPRPRTQRSLDESPF